jgi:hypothetical protein
MARSHRAKGKQLTAFGRTQCVSEWARELGVSRNTIDTRLANGWSIERAVSESPGKSGPKRRAA